jgi:uncharacterized protein (TIGR03435 family)
MTQFPFTRSRATNPRSFASSQTGSRGQDVRHASMTSSYVLSRTVSQSRRSRIRASTVSAICVYFTRSGFRNRLSLVALLSTVAAFSQTRPAFDTASVKPNDRGGGAFVQALQGRLVMTNFVPRRLLLVAWDIQDYQLAGDPPWLASEHYDIEAKADGNPSVQQMEGPMLQALVEDRFKLKLHREARQLPVYRLTIAKGGAKLMPSKEGGCIPYAVDSPPPPSAAPGEPRPNFCGFRSAAASGSSRSLDGTGITIAALAASLSRTYNSELGRNVLDGTGLPGTYDVHLKWTIGDLKATDPANSAADPPGLSIFTALQEQLGLRLESAKSSVDVLVIDHIEKPSAN